MKLRILTLPTFPIMEIMIIVAVIMISLGFGSLIFDYKKSDIIEMNRLQHIRTDTLTPDEKREFANELKRFNPPDR
jgi:hypothetical protein